MFSLLTYLPILLCLTQEAELMISVRKFVYQKDMSEHCRRRVMPSVFLGRHVVEAHSQILHFSQLEVPYSCFISLRTESGSNIILVIQLTTGDSPVSVCEENDNQVIVYEMGETFGGYWGAVPDSVLRQESRTPKKFYTLKTTTPEPVTEESLTEDTTEDATVTETTTQATAQEIPNEENYFRIEVPLVNVSGRMVADKDASNNPQELAFDMEDTFDFVYDVTPRAGVSYDTSILPLVQFSVRPQQSKRREGDEGASGTEPRYELDYEVQGVTPDPRLTFSYIRGDTYNKSSRFQHKYRPRANRLLKLKKKQMPIFVAEEKPPYFKKTISVHDSRRFPKTDLLPPAVVTKEVNIEHIIEDLLKQISNKSEEVRSDKDKEESLNTTKLLHKISNMQHNISAYLSPNLSIYNDQVTERKSVGLNLAMRNDFSSFTRISLEPRTQNFHDLNELVASTSTTTHSDRNLFAERSTDTGDDWEFAKKLNKTINKKVFNGTTTTNVEFLHANDKEHFNSDSKGNGTKLVTLEENDKAVTNSLTTQLSNSVDQLSTMDMNTTIAFRPKVGSMVDHKSWENIVQAAPVMAVLLNNTTPDNNTRNATKKASTTSFSVKRKKRFINMIPIESARPHNLTTDQEIVTTPESLYHFADMQDFARLVELRDDEIHGRISLRHLDRYVGAALFNMCDTANVSHHVFLFNSSRLVIAINNFTMKRMTIVATPARTLMTAEARCPPAHLECQVSGARACIDSMTACDGVPNCGARDIYDEDRLMCGAAQGLQHNVYLAAFTFLAVLLTVLYTVHYWLKRCVPKVSDAFFIYTDGSENILYLDSIMRSPNDIDDVPKLVYHSNLFEDSAGPYQKKDKTIIGRLRNYFRQHCCRKKLHKEEAESVELDRIASGSLLGMTDSRRLYSFTELEIRKMQGFGHLDASVQTGDSLEIEFLNEMNKKKEVNVSPTKSLKTEQSAKPEIVKDDALINSKESSVYQKSLLSYDSELNLLKFFKDARAASAQYDNAVKRRDTREALRPNKHVIAVGEETEIQNTFYVQPIHEIILSSSSDEATNLEAEFGKPESSIQATKRLRFDDNLTTISDEAVEDGTKKQHTVGIGAIKTINQEGESNEEEEEQTSGRVRRFWGSNKGKKPKDKKKAQMPLR